MHAGLMDDRWNEASQNDEDNASIVSEPLYYSNTSNVSNLVIF